MRYALGYNGASAHHLAWWGRNIANPLEPSTQIRFSRLRTPLPTGVDGNGFGRQVGSLVINDNILNANYNAFTAKVEKRWSDGLSFLSSFTWSKGIDYGLSSLNERSEALVGSGAIVSHYPRDLWRNRAASALTRDFAYSASVLYELPAGPGKGHFESGPASWLLGGWMLGGILSMQSGPWIAHSFLPNTQNNGGVYRGDLVGEINLPESERDSLRWFNPSAIVAGPEGEFGNAGRNLIEGAGRKNFDLLLSKYFLLPWEGHRLQFRFEAFNLTNTPHLGPPTDNPGTFNNTRTNRPDVARILSADQPRIIQFALKYLF